MKTRTWFLGAAAAIGLAAPASAQRVSWSVSFSSGPIFVSSSSCRPVFVAPPRPVYVAPSRVIVVPPPVYVTPPPAYHGYRYRPPPPPPPPAYSSIRRSGVYAYAPGPRRVIHSETYGRPGIIQEWCPRSQIWITIGSERLR